MTSPLHLRAPLAALGGSLHCSPRSPRTRSWDSHHLGGLVVHDDDDDAVLAEPAATGASNRLLGVASVSATAVEVQQSEDCTCIIIAHGCNPKITPIFADRGIPEPCCTVIVI